ncbi:hypothetical protein V5O48_018595 [Marasmius crinis-equi]|uniref:Uncharacterized protein n=1 Tax=Marasmius crinis-equi TaxID=585013 RepID=A0ABR3EKQ1_9AGAR
MGPFRYVICMRYFAMLQLVKWARHIQSNISFKRVVAWLEFEMGGFNRGLSLSSCYVRVFMNRQSAEAHWIVLCKVHEIVQEETGCELLFRHLHVSSKDKVDFNGILSWTVDQHGGQVKEWLADKFRSKFAFPAMCWEKSFILLPIWQATDGTSNIIESMHFDVLQEGGHSTLLAGVLAGSKFDCFQDQTMKASLQTGVPWRKGMRTSSSCQLNVVQRQATSKTRRLTGENEKVEEQNEALLRARDVVYPAHIKVAQSSTSVQRQQAAKALVKAEEKYQKLLDASEKMADARLGLGTVEVELYELDMSDDLSEE